MRPLAPSSRTDACRLQTISLRSSWPCRIACVRSLAFGRRFFPLPLASRTVVDRASPLSFVPFFAVHAVKNTAPADAGAVSFLPERLLLLRSMSTQTAEPRKVWPHVTHCSCGADVVRGKHETTGRVVTLDAWPVIVGVGPCPACRGNGRMQIAMPAVGGERYTSLPGDLEGRTTWRGSMTSCPECRGSGERGEELSSEHVVMSMDGVVRAEPVRASHWDSAYRRHECEQRGDA